MSHEITFDSFVRKSCQRETSHWWYLRWQLTRQSLLKAINYQILSLVIYLATQSLHSAPSSCDRRCFAIVSADHWRRRAVRRNFGRGSVLTLRIEILWSVIGGLIYSKAKALKWRIESYLSGKNPSVPVDWLLCRPLIPRCSRSRIYCTASI